MSDAPYPESEESVTVVPQSCGLCFHDRVLTAYGLKWPIEGNPSNHLYVCGRCLAAEEVNRMVIALIEHLSDQDLSSGRGRIGHWGEMVAARALMERGWEADRDGWFNPLEIEPVHHTIMKAIFVEFGRNFGYAN